MSTEKFFRQINNPIYFSLYLMTNLPSAFRSGIKAETVSSEKIITSVPYKFFTKNPFHSTYFACLAMAAEMATGIAVMAAIKSSDKRVSMLVVKIEADFFKKATERTYFECNGFEAAMQTIKDAIKSNQSQQLSLISKGTLKDGTPVADFKITWSFKVKND